MLDDSTKPSLEASPETVWLMYEMNGGIISTADLAIKIGEALCETHYGAAEVRRQRPLSAVDKGTFWRIEGNWNRDGNKDGPGAFFLSIQKRDGLITDLGQWGPVLRGPQPGSKEWWDRLTPNDKDKEE